MGGGCPPTTLCFLHWNWSCVSQHSLAAAKKGSRKNCCHQRVCRRYHFCSKVFLKSKISSYNLICCKIAPCFITAEIFLSLFFLLCHFCFLIILSFSFQQACTVSQQCLKSCLYSVSKNLLQGIWSFKSKSENREGKNKVFSRYSDEAEYMPAVTGLGASVKYEESHFLGFPQYVMLVVRRSWPACHSLHAVSQRSPQGVPSKTEVGERMKCCLRILHLHYEKPIKRAINIAWTCFLLSLPVAVPVPPLTPHRIMYERCHIVNFVYNEGTLMLEA